MPDGQYIGEQQGRRRERVTVNGLEATRTFYSPWADRYDISLPKLGDLYDDETFAYLWCTSIEPEEDEDGNAVIVCRYGNESQLGEEFYEFNCDFSCEVLDTTKGMTWDDAGTSVDVPVSTIYPIMEEVVTVRAATADRTSIRSAVGKVNSEEFHGAAVGCLLLEGASLRISRDQDGNVLSAQSTFKFLYRERPHNEVYREARIKTTKDGLRLCWHNDPNATDDDYYTTDTSKIGDPVYVSGTAGTSGWDKPYYMDGTTKKYRYDECDFASVLGIPDVT